MALQPGFVNPAGAGNRSTQEAVHADIGGCGRIAQCDKGYPVQGREKAAHSLDHGCESVCDRRKVKIYQEHRPCFLPMICLAEQSWGNMGRA